MKKILSIVAIMLLGTIVFAGSSAGTAAATFLKIELGAKPSALGDAFIGLADDFNAIRLNPSGLAFMDQGTVAFSHMNWIADTQINSASAVYSMEGIGTFGFTWLSLGYGDIPRTDETGVEDGTFTAADSMFALAYGREINEAFGVGAVMKYISSTIDSYSAGTVAIDVGGLYKVQVADRPLGIGLSIRNVGGQMTYESEGDPIPMYFGAGVSYGALVSDTNNVIVLLDLGKSTDTDLKFNIGAEYSFKDYLAIRLGYKGGDYDVEGFSGGLGAGYTLENGMKLNLDYAYGSTIEAFDTVHRISFSFSF